MRQNIKGFADIGVGKILNMHAIDLPLESIEKVLCFDTLEHVEYPLMALKEMHRILKSLMELK